MIDRLIWKIKFTYWYVKFKGYMHISYVYSVSTCYNENHDGKHEVLTPREAASEIINWAMK